MVVFLLCFVFFFKDTATTEIYTLSLHDALPISMKGEATMTEEVTDLVASDVKAALDKQFNSPPRDEFRLRMSNIGRPKCQLWLDRKSTRLNSSHGYISYAVFCLKKKKQKNNKQKTKTKTVFRSEEKRTGATPDTVRKTYGQDAL